jgi:putative endopeptidase
MTKDMYRLMIAISSIALLFTTSCNNNQKAMNAENKVPAFDTSGIDRTMRPCDDFDNFANGNWKKHNPIPSTEGSWGSFDVLDKETREVKIKGIVKELLGQKDLKKSSDAQLITGFYRSYMDTATIEKRGITPIMPMIDKINATKNAMDLFALAGELAKYDIDGPFMVYVSADDRKSTMNAVSMGQGGLSLRDRNYYENQDSAMVKVRAEFVKHIDKMFGMADWKTTNPGKTILGFETKLALLQLKNFELRDPVKIYNKIPFAELKKRAPGINWSDYYKNYNLTTDTVIVWNLDYLKNLNKLVRETPVEDLRTYFR